MRTLSRESPDLQSLLPNTQALRIPQDLRFSGNNDKPLRNRTLGILKQQWFKFYVCKNLDATMYMCKFKHKDANFPFFLVEYMSKMGQLFVTQP